MTRYPELNNDPIRRPKEIVLILHVCLSVVNDLMKSGALKKIQISPRCVGVLQSDIDAYLQNQRTQKKPFE
jgi:predicted DNA-binding transcriptional regulator AlpA